MTRGKIDWAILIVMAIIVVVVGGMVFDTVATKLENDIERCQDAGGEQTAHGDLMYCEFDNETGYALGSDEAPEPMDEPGEIRSGPGTFKLLVASGVVGVVVVILGVIRRYQS